MSEDNFDYLKDIEKRFIDYLNTGNLIYIKEEDLEDLIDYFEDTEQRKFLKEAIKLGLKLFPNSSTFLRKEGIQLFKSKKYDDAIADFEKLILNDPSDLDAIKYLFLSYVYNKNILKAQYYFNFFNDFINKDPEDIFYQAEDLYFFVFKDNKLFYFLLEIKKLSKANQLILEKAFILYNAVCQKLNNDETKSLCFERMASCLIVTADTDKARKNLKKLLKIYPFNSNAWIYLSLIEAVEDNIPKAIKYIDYAVAIEPEAKEPNLILAALLIYSERYHEAISLLDSMCHKYEDNILFNLLSECYEKIGDYQVSIYYLEKCLELDSEDYDALFKITKALLNINKTSQAYKYIKQIKKIYDENDELYYLFAIYYFKIKKYDLSLKYINKALKLEPFEHDYIILKSNVLEAIGNISKSINFLKSYIAEFEENSYILYKIAGMYVKLKDISNAVEYLKIAINKDLLFVSKFIYEYPQAKMYKEIKRLLNL